MKFIKTSIHDHIASITFNNDKKRNALSNEMLQELEDAFDELIDQDIRAVIIKSNPKIEVWSAGLDISELPKPGIDPLPYSHPLEQIMRKIENFKAPVIAMITGSVWGGGFDLAVTCDILIGTPKCTFAITPAKIGVPYNAAGLMHFMNIVELNIAKEMFFTAEPIAAPRAYSLGILNHMIEENEIEDYTYKMARKITHNSPLSISVIKEQLNLLGKARPISPDVFERLYELRKNVYNSYDFTEGKKAFLEKRHPIFKGK